MLSEVLGKIGKHSLIYSVGNIFSQGMGFIMIPVYTSYLTPQDYGVIELLDLTSHVLVMIIGARLSFTLLRFYYEYAEETHRKEVVSTVLISIFILNLVALSVLIPFRGTFSLLILGDAQFGPYYTVIFMTLCLSLINEVGLTYLRARQQSFTYCCVSLGNLILGLSLNIYFIAFLEWGIWGVLYSGLISGTIMSIGLSIRTFSQVRFSFSVSKLKEMLKYGLPLVPATVGTFIMTVSDRFFLQHFGSLHDVGLYSLGFKIGMAISVLLVTPFLLFWGAYQFEIAQKSDAHALFSRILTYFTFLLCCAALGLSLLSTNILQAMSDPQFWEAAEIVPVIALSCVFWGWSYYFQTGIQLKKKTKYMAYINGSAALVKLLLNYSLIPAFGVMGAACGTLLTFIFVALANWFVAKKLYPIRYEYQRLAKLLCVGIILFWISTILVHEGLMEELLLKTILWLSVPVALFLLFFFKPEELQLAQNKGKSSAAFLLALIGKTYASIRDQRSSRE